jgi:hypothetical protein
MLRRFVFSCSTFGGHEVILNVSNDSSLKELVNQGVKKLHDLLLVYHFEMLLDVLRKKQYHIHDNSIEQILSKDQSVYICECKNEFSMKPNHISIDVKSS